MTSPTAWKCLRFAAAIGLAAVAPQAPGADNPLARTSSARIEGTWNGTDLERRSACTNAQNVGSRGTYAQFDVTSDPLAHTLGITQTGITGLTCTYFGDYASGLAGRTWSGSYSCSDGKRGTFRSLGILVTDIALAIHLAIQLDTTETCAIDAVIAAGRPAP